MKIGKVLGTVVCTQKEQSLEGIKLLLLTPLNEDLTEAGGPLVACDTVQAGEGDIVLFESGREAALALENWFNPTDAAIMGIVDRLDVADEFGKGSGGDSVESSGRNNSGTVKKSRAKRKAPAKKKKG